MLRGKGGRIYPTLPTEDAYYYPANAAGQGGPGLGVEIPENSVCIVEIKEGGEEQV